MQHYLLTLRFIYESLGYFYLIFNVCLGSITLPLKRALVLLPFFMATKKKP